MLADQFTAIFRTEHRKVRDLLMELKQAFLERDASRLNGLLYAILAFTGPHFRYEEEALFPVLREAFGEEYIERLLCEHDRSIQTAGQLQAIAGKPLLTEADAREAVRLIAALMPHVSDCDGLSLLVETLPEETVKAILEARARCLHERLGLLQWASESRKRGLPIRKECVAV